MNPLQRAVALAVIVAACAVTVYSGSWNNAFIWDDPIVLEQQMVAFKSISDCFYPPLKIPQYGLFYYRPLVMVSYMIDKHFTGPRPMELPKGAINPFHVSVVIYHAIVSVLVFLFGRALVASKPWGEWAAFAGALIFAVHPIHTESVCWMAGRSDVLASLGLVPALTLFVVGRQRDSRILFVLSALFFLIGVLAKESGVGALVALPLLDLIPAGRRGRAGSHAQNPSSPPSGSAKKAASGGKQNSKRAAAGKTPRFVRETLKATAFFRYGPFVAAAIVYWCMRWADLHRTSRSRGLAHIAVAVDLQTQKHRISETLLDLIGAIGFYVRKAFVPTRLNAFVADAPKDPLTLVIGIVAIVGGIALGVWAYRRGSRVGLVLGALFFATIAPSLAIAAFDISEAQVAERYLYIPSIAVCLGVPYLVGLVIEKLRKDSLVTFARGALAGALAVGVAVTGAFAYATSLRNETWSDDKTFWEDAVAKAPHQGLPHLHLGLVYDRWPTEDPEEVKKYKALARKEFETALDEKNVIYDVEGRSIAWNNLANVYLWEDDYAKAEECFRNAIAMRETYHTPYYGLGLVYYRKALDAQHEGKGDEALKVMSRSRDELQQAIGLNENYVKAYLLLGTVQLALNQPGRARPALQKVVSLVPGTAEAARAKELLDRIAASSAGTSGAADGGGAATSGQR